MFHAPSTNITEINQYEENIILLSITAICWHC